MPDEASASPANPAESLPLRETPRWERDIIERLAFEALVERRRARRWKWFFRFTLLAFLVVGVALWMAPEWSATSPGGTHSALVDVRGILSEGEGESADRIVAALRNAFEDPATAGVILRVNSPGGSPVQAGYIYDEIVRLRDLHPNTPLYAVIVDIAASGGYYIAAAADRIYASRASVIGSIGVRMNGFGFVDAMDKLGVERRLITAGEHKGLLDPFLPVREEELAHLRTLLEEVHGHFIEVVKRGRGDRLADNEDIFSGLIWTGAQAVDLGLVDGFGSSGHVAREIIGAEEIVDFTPRPSHLEALAEHLGVGLARVLGMAPGSAALSLQ